MIPLIEYITDGNTIYSRGNLFFPTYYNIAYTMLRLFYYYLILSYILYIIKLLIYIIYRGEFLLWSLSLPNHSIEVKILDYNDML